MAPVAPRVAAAPVSYGVFEITVGRPGLPDGPALVEAMAAAGTYVESPREVEVLLERMDTSLLGLCFDTGHSAFGGGNPLALLRHAGELVNHVHFKDVDLELLARLHAEGKGLEEAWAAGVFCELGTGGAQVDECLE